MALTHRKGPGPTRLTHNPSLLDLTIPHRRLLNMILLSLAMESRLATLLAQLLHLKGHVKGHIKDYLKSRPKSLLLSQLLSPPNPNQGDAPAPGSIPVIIRAAATSLNT